MTKIKKAKCCGTCKYWLGSYYADGKPCSLKHPIGSFDEWDDINSEDNRYVIDVCDKHEWDEDD